MTIPRVKGEEQREEGERLQVNKEGVIQNQETKRDEDSDIEGGGVK